MRRALLFSVVTLAAAGVVIPVSAQPPPKRVVIALWTETPEQNLVPRPDEDVPADRLLRYLDRQADLALGLFSSMQGRYDQRQVLLDMSQGSRQPRSLYDDSLPELQVVPRDTTATIDGWAQARRRARNVSVTLRPGLLAASVPGGAAFVGVEGETSGAVVAADRAGHVALFSPGPLETLVPRAESALTERRLVVVGLPAGPAGRAALAELLHRRGRDVIIVAHVPPTSPRHAVAVADDQFYRLPAFGIAGDGYHATARSGSTRQPGVVSAIDLAPTALRELGIKVPSAMRGDRIEVGRDRSASRLETLRRRWRDARAGAQASSIHRVVLVSVFAALVLAAVTGLRRGLRTGLRLGGLSMMWWPSVVLLAGPLAVTHRSIEASLIPAGALAAAIVSDRLRRWPRSALAPAAAGLVLYTADLAFGGRLLSVSLVSPSILAGGRFYGVSNELEPVLPILALIGLAAWLHGRNGKPVGAYAVIGAAVALVLGWGRLGADVGGVLTVLGAFFAAALVVGRRRITARTVLLCAALAVVAILVLLLIDVGLGGDSHLSRNVDRSQGFTDLSELVTRRYELMASVLDNGTTLSMLALSLAAVAGAVRNRRELYAPLTSSVWRAVLVGGLAGGIVGAVTNDSGPVLLINSVIALAAVTAYVQGGPAGELPP